ncbi:hypothetical protein Tco_0576997 [Tanacetum coccineum]
MFSAAGDGVTNNVTPSQQRPRRRHWISRRHQSTRPSPLSRIFSLMTASRLKRDAVHRGIEWDKVENLNPQSTPQVLPSFEEYTPPATYPEEVEETLGIPIEVEPLDDTPLEDLGLNTYNP